MKWWMLRAGEYQVVNVISDCRVSGFVGNTLAIDSDGTKSGEKVSDGEKSDSESDSEASSESDSEDSSESEFESSSQSSSVSGSEEEDDDDVEEEDDEDGDGEMKEKALEEGEVDVERMIEDLFVRELFDWCDKDEIFALPGLCGLSMSSLLGLSMSANEVKVVYHFSFVLLYLLTMSCCLYNFPKILKVIYQVD